jgi:NADPH:quinone reductase-like Zn-dependent oxidoreductase
LRVLKAGGKLISISGPPDPEFGRQIGTPPLVKGVMRMLSSGVRRKAKSRGVDYSFLFMKASGSQLHEITRLFDAGVIRPVIEFRGEASRDHIRQPGRRRVDGRPRHFDGGDGQGRHHLHQGHGP